MNYFKGMLSLKLKPNKLPQIIMGTIKQTNKQKVDWRLPALMSNPEMI